MYIYISLGGSFNTRTLAPSLDQRQVIYVMGDHDNDNIIVIVTNIIYYIMVYFIMLFFAYKKEV